MPFTFNEVFGSVALLISCGAAFLLVKLLLSNTLQQEKFFNSLAKCYTELESSSKKLETLCTVLDRRFSNMEESKSTTDPILLNSLQRFDKVSQEIRERLDDLFLPDPGSTAQEMPNEALLEELTKMQSSLEELTGQLRRNNYLSMNENVEMAAMRKRIESYQSMVMKARSEAKQSETVMADLRMEIDRLRSQPPRMISAEDQPSELQNEIQALDNEKKALEAKVKALQDEMNRNNIEKKFIEERFIGGLS